MDDILSSPVPTDVNDVLNEAVILATSVTTSSDSVEEEQQEEILDRYDISINYYYFLITYLYLKKKKKIRLEEYIEVVQAEGGQEEIESLGQSVINTAEEILAENPSDETLDEVYLLLETLESAISCASECGSPPVVLQVWCWNLGV